MLTGFDTFVEAYTAYTASNELPSSLENDIQQLNTSTSRRDSQNNSDDDEDSDNDDDDGAQNDIHHCHTDEWMLVCRAYSMLEPQIDVQKEHDWNAAAQRYPNLLEAPSFISHHRDTVIQLVS